MPIDPRELMLKLYDKFCWFDNELQAELREQGWPDVSRAQSLVMLDLVRGVRRPSDIARNLRVSRQAMHITLRQMEDIGIIAFSPDPDNRRYRLIVFTEMGQKMNERALLAVTRLTNQMIAALGGDRAEAFVDCLTTSWDSPE